MRCSTRCLLLGVLALLMSGAALAQTRLLIASGELPPYVSEQRADSFLQDLFDAIGPLMNVRFEFVFMPWKRCEIAVARHEVWGAVPYVPTPEREQQMLFSAPLYDKKTVFFYYADKPRAWVFESLEDLRGQRVGAVRGYFYEAMLLQAGLTLDYAVSEESNFRKLQAGRVDLVPAVDAVGLILARRLFSPAEAARFHRLPKPLHTGANYLMVSKSHPDAQALLDRFNEALQTLRKNGTYRAIAQRHRINETGSLD